jgi:hypothetical protein
VPPRKNQTRQEPRTRALQCAYIERGRRCSSRKTTGNPPICVPHRIVLERAAHAPPRDVLSSLLGSLLSGQRVAPEQIGAAVLGTVRDVLFPGISLDEMQRRASDYQRRAAAFAASEAARRASGTPPPPPPPSDRQVMYDEYARAQACQVLGFAPDEALTEEVVRRRRQKLARKHHPDAGGSASAMAEVNAAADVLLAAIASDGVGSAKARGTR